MTLIHDLKWSYLKKKYKMLLIEIKFRSYFLSEVAVILRTCKSDDMYIMCTCLIYWVRFYKWYTGYLTIIIFQVTFRNRNTYLFQWFRADRRWGVVYRPSKLTAFNKTYKITSVLRAAANKSTPCDKQEYMLTKSKINCFKTSVH